MQKQYLSALTIDERKQFLRVEAYFIESTDDCIECFPLVTKESEEMFVCLDRKLIEEVAFLVPVHTRIITSAEFLLDPLSFSGFFLVNRDAESQSKRIWVLNDESFEKLILKWGQPFCWWRGLTPPLKSPQVDSPPTRYHPRRWRRN